MHLYEILAQSSGQWRKDGYPSDEYPVIGEILDHQTDPETGSLRYLRTPQLRALEVYWYLRLVKGTPKIFDLYKDLYASKAELLTALGIPNEALQAADFDFQQLWQMLAEDDDFVREFKLQALRESLNLDYPSYIFALAMGAGKTVLIGAIVATEFAMALEHPENDFAHNALVFAPGKTILEALRELIEVPYDRILPPRLYKPFIASLKLTFTRDVTPLRASTTPTSTVCVDEVAHVTADAGTEQEPTGIEIVQIGPDHGEQPPEVRVRTRSESVELDLGRSCLDEAIVDARVEHAHQ